MPWSQELRNYVNTQLEGRKPRLGARWAALQEELSLCGEEEALLLSYLYVTLPSADLGDYSPRFFREAACQALAARREFPWCAALPESLFLREVLCPRVNNEELSPCRELFCSQLAPRVKGLPLEEAILEVNRWCAEQATYRSTDDRTASALQVYQCGWGRCGEESTFLTNALRSVGIAARQVYAPWWSHCDDNHAWVEIFDGASWRYLGACEPEPVLDRGWFTHAASRAVMVHARSFVAGSREEAAFLFPGLDPLDWDLREGVAYENRTAHYGRAKLLTVEVRDGRGSPVQGAGVAFSVMNMAAPQEVARRTTDEAGRAQLRVGRGSLLLTAWDPEAPGLLGEALVPPEGESVQVVLGRALAPQGEADFAAPADGDVSVPALRREQREARQACLGRAAALREEKSRAWQEQRPAPPTGQKGRVWSALTEKDRAGQVPEAVLEDALAAFRWEPSFPQEAFQRGLLSPRVGLEVLTPWHKRLAEQFSPEEAEAARQDPSRLWAWVESRVSLDGDCYAALWGTPQGMLSLGRATAFGRGMLFCAACRALGVPSYLQDGTPWFWKDGAFHPLWGGEPAARLALAAPADRPALPGQDYALFRKGPQGWQPVTAPALAAGMEEELPLPPGEYRLWTVNRLPSGSQLVWWRAVSLEEGQRQACALSFREGRAEDMLQRCPLPEFSLWEEAGREVPGRQVLAAQHLTVLCLLEPSREPTEHILNELRESAPALEASGCGLCLVVEDFSHQQDPTLQRALQALPGAQVWRGDFPEVVPALARRMFLDPDRLPLVLLVNSRGECLYGCCGYNVGTAALLLRLMAAAEVFPQEGETC